MKPVRFHDSARAELVNEVLYYATLSPRLGERLATAVEQATQLAAAFPDMGAPYKHGTRRVFTRKFPFSIVYVVRDEEVRVVAIAPFSRKPGYWHSRVEDAPYG